jgi:hypothetical protein
MMDAEIHFAPPAFAGAGGQYAASSRPRYSPIGPAIGSARDPQICSRLASPSSRDPVKYPGWPGYFTRPATNSFTSGFLQGFRVFMPGSIS